MMRRLSNVLSAGAFAALLFAQGALAQVTPGGTPPGAVPRPGPVESAPLAPPPGVSAPAQAAPPSGTTRTVVPLPTLVPNPGDPTDVDSVTLPGKPVAMIAGVSTWDEGFTSLVNAFRKIEEELTRAAISPAGRPLTLFLKTDDLGFEYQAMVPIPQPNTGRPGLSPEVRFGTTPQGQALRFVHKSSYEEIDDTYETITAYLDAKGVAVKEMFIEEYVTDLTTPDDPNLEVNVFVQPQ
jgi:effector-binding domain-containing protein